MKDNEKTAVKDKYLLTINEASRYFGIGVNKLRRIVAENMDADWLLQNGNRVLIKRRLFETYIDKVEVI